MKVENKASSSQFIVQQEKIEIPHLSELCLYACQFDKTLYQPDLFKQYGIVYPESIIKAVDKRQAEYLAGRYSAILALKQLGIKGFNISTGQHRSPVWPKDVVGSITHALNKAYAAVSYHSIFSYIGIDYEKIIEIKTAENINQMIINDKERHSLIDSGFDFTTTLTIIFSAKESLFKALYPHVGQYFDFSAAEMIHISKENQSFELKLSQSLTNNLLVGRCFKGWFQVEPTNVLTVIAIQ